MGAEKIISLLIFALVSSITPGPNNLMLLTSGINFGFHRTLPHALGVSGGFSFMVLLVGLGLMKLFALYPMVQKVLQATSLSYLFYLAYRIATAVPAENEKRKKGRPMTFMQAVLFQWVNPKAWSMALTAVSLYTQEYNGETVLYVTLIFGLVNFPCVSVWVVLGEQLKSFLNDKNKLRFFNRSMALLLVGSTLVLLF